VVRLKLGESGPRVKGADSVGCAAVRVLFWQRSASELGAALVARAEHVEVPASLAQAEASIGAAAHLAGVVRIV
jgi:hypothetical protein